MDRLTNWKLLTDSLREQLCSSYGYYHSLRPALEATMSEGWLMNSRESLLGLLATLSDLNTTGAAQLRLWDDVSPSG